MRSYILSNPIFIDEPNNTGSVPPGRSVRPTLKAPTSPITAYLGFIGSGNVGNPPTSATAIQQIFRSADRTALCERADQQRIPGCHYAYQSSTFGWTADGLFWRYL